MGFIDDLALVEVLIGMVAVLFAYVGVVSWWYIRTNKPKLLRETLKASAVPVGVVGLITAALGLWGEMTWPFNVTFGTTNFLAGYNIFFLDVMVMFAIVCLAYAVVAYTGKHLNSVGVLAVVAGICTAFYGYVGYNLAPNLQYTKDPWETFALYGAFGLAAILAFPATVLVDYYLHHAETGQAIWQRSTSTLRLRTSMGSRAAQPVSGVDSQEEIPAQTLKFRVPIVLQLVMLAFPVMMVLAAVAAFWYFGVTLPGHLGNGAAGAP